MSRVPGVNRGKSQTLAIGAAALLVLPFALQAIGLTIDTATVAVVLAMAVMGLNLLVGYTGLVSFGQSAWFVTSRSCGAFFFSAQ